MLTNFGIRHAQPTTRAVIVRHRDRATFLLRTMRQTPMRRGGTSPHREIEARIAAAIEKAGVAARLAQRVARQLVLKFDVAELGGPPTWNAIGGVLRREAEQLTNRLGLVDRQIVVTLPKLAPDEVERFLEELRAADPSIARTILNSALDAAEPRAAGRRYLGEYHRVIEELNKIDAGIARTVANATFMARVPRKKAMDAPQTIRGPREEISRRRGFCPHGGQSGVSRCRSAQGRTPLHR